MSKQKEEEYVYLSRKRKSSPSVKNSFKGPSQIAASKNLDKPSHHQSSFTWGQQGTKQRVHEKFLLLAEAFTLLQKYSYSTAYLKVVADSGSQQ